MGRTFLRFSEVQKLIRVKDDQTMSSILGHSACLVTIAEVTRVEDISQMADFVNDLRVPMKYLLLIVSRLDLNLLGNTNLNYNILIMETSAGKLKILKFS